MSGIGALGGAGSIQQIMAMRQQILDRSQLLQQIHTPTPGSAEPTAPQGPAGGFTDALKSALDGVSATQAKAADLSAGFEQGTVTDVASMMLARQEAGIAFEATLQVRNRLLSAYQDIMRMGV